MYTFHHHDVLLSDSTVINLVPDPCLSEPCDVNAVCLRGGLLTDAFTCTCQAPFTEGDGFNCSGT